MDAGTLAGVLAILALGFFGFAVLAACVLSSRISRAQGDDE